MVGAITAALGLVTAGCHVVFELAPPPPPGEVDAAGVTDAEAPTVDAPPDAPPCTPRAFPPVTVIADTMLIDENDNMNPSIRRGADDIINIGLEQSRVLLRFALSPVMLERLEPGVPGPASALLTISLRPNDCPGGCTNGPTSFQVHAATNDWLEGNGMTYNGAAWFARRQVSSSDPARVDWQLPGANGPLDRNPARLGGDVMVANPAGGPLSIPLPLSDVAIAALRERVAGSQLSLLLVPIAGGTLFLRAREDSAAATTLAFSICE